MLFTRMLAIWMYTLDWWRSNSSKYPRLSILARRYLDIPWTLLLPSDRISSKAGLILTKRHNHRSSSCVDKTKSEQNEILFCLNNMFYVIILYFTKFHIQILLVCYIPLKPGTHGKACLTSSCLTVYTPLIHVFPRLPCQTYKIEHCSIF
jgi:hypothetical protein